MGGGEEAREGMDGEREGSYIGIWGGGIKRE